MKAPDAMLDKMHRKAYRAYKTLGEEAKAEEVRQYVLKTYGIDLAAE